MKSEFKSVCNKGFSMTFENGLTISVQFGGNNYCANYLTETAGKEHLQPHTYCPDAQIAIWDKKGNWFNFGCDTIKGYCSTEEVANWIYKVSKAKNLKSIK